MRLNAWLENWQNRSHVSDTIRDVLLDVQCKFQLDSVNTSDLRASCVCVIVTRYENAETKSRAALRDQILRRLT
jgi:hypothetical protein